MKKLPILLSFLTASLTLSTLISAKTEALSFYTVDELLSYREQVNAEETIACGDNTVCLNNFRETRKQNDDKYATLTILEPYQFILTSINPELGTVKLLVFSEDMITKYSGGGGQSIELRSLLVGWFDTAEAADQFSRAARIPEQFLNNEIPGIHPILGLVGDEALAVEKDREVEYGIASSILENSNGYYEYKAKTNLINKSAHIDYRSCLTAEGYPHGECKLIVSSSSIRYIFIPTEEEPLEPELPEEPTEPGLSVELIEPEQPEEPEEPASETIKDIEEEGITTISEASKPVTSIISPKTPNTGSYTNVCKKDVEFPWWLGVLIFTGDIIFLWFFGPKNRKNPRKNP